MAEPDRVPSEPADTDVPTQGEVIPDRFSTDEVFQRIVADADHEVTSGVRELFFSALAAGFAITVTFLLYASLYPRTDGGIAAVMLYPLGFIYIIIGGYQLYTENTLPPVALTLERLVSIPTLLRHWLIVLIGNFAGGAAGAVVLAYGGVFSPEAAAVAVDLAHKGVETPIVSLFFKGAFAGFIVAGVVWLDFAVRDTVSRLVIVYLAFLAIPLGNLFHVVVSFTESIYTVLAGDLSVVVAMTEFVVPVAIGNTVGGIVLVTIVNYYQTSERRLEVDRFEHVRRLSIREWVLGNLAGRSYVPIVDTVEDIVRDPDSHRVLVPITNPRTETKLVRLACTFAAAREKGTVHAVHVVQTPGHVSSDEERHDRILEESDRLLEDVRRVGEQYDVGFETSTIVSTRSLEEVFDRARRTRPDLVVLGWGEDKLWDSARAEKPVHELTNRLPCDFLILKDRGLDCSRVLVPTAGGPDSSLSAEIAKILQAASDAKVTLLHVVDDQRHCDAGERFLAEWAAEHDLEAADQLVVAGDVERTIEREAEDHTLVMLGATERGLLARLVTGSLHLQVVNDVECSVALAERPHERAFWKRLFGRGRRRSIPSDRYQDDP
ncbi:formate transporter [Halorhabdus sp. CBA1104]|uniref:formate/nitrite transporter family protein n=1 Tax=Halorhabdus sp. CBA1104 TaxID=1380432 RepID=UPI0012B3E6BC|nr:formate/nitrite transporter family protein [Halorhabdus sp. CBA1104]QGN06434.1 formate transporter [Halorhabdus sp. CBA1104]